MRFPPDPVRPSGRAAVAAAAERSTGARAGWSALRRTGVAWVLSGMLGVGCDPGPALVRASGAAGTGGESAAGPSWSGAVRPLLAEHCLPCHGPDAAAREADLRLDTRAGLTADRREGAAVVPGRPDASRLLARVRAHGDERMPPAEAGRALRADEVDVLRRWIAAGAAVEPHWAHAPARVVAPPDVPGIAHPVDRFVAARLAQRGLELAPRADRRSLARRLSLDLIGMVPTEREVRRLLDDRRADAVERFVDRLLASPHYGERWARHWLDQARYADSHGFTIDGGRSMWPWRDGVVDAINADQPFDRFTIEQLAGDLLPGATVAQRVASGFHRNTLVNQEGGAKDEENRVLAVIDRVDTTGAVWLGTTLSCARCHDHKYDPISQREYFGLFAAFDQTADGGVSTGPALAVPADEQQAVALAAWEQRDTELGEQLAAREQAALAGWRVFAASRATGSNGPELRPLSDGSWLSVGHRPLDSVYDLSGPSDGGPVAWLALDLLPDPSLPAGGPGRAGNGNLVLERLRLSTRTGDATAWRHVPLVEARADVEQDTRADGGGHYPVIGALDDEAGTGWAIQPHTGVPHRALFRLAEPLPAGPRELRIELVQEHGEAHVAGRFRLALGDGAVDADAAVPGERTALWREWLAHRRERPALPTSLVMERRAEPRITRLFRRGDPYDRGDVVPPGVPAVMAHVGGGAPVRDRLDLARWLVHDDNALVRRVTVNRWWQRFFGTGLVGTDSDFGLRGERPSHPDLLEWLAGELLRVGWSRKALHRWIVTSHTYQQSSGPRGELASRDPHNRWLARQRPLRLEAEVLRDSALRAAGLLVPTLGGPPVQPPQPDGMFRFTQSARRWTASEGDDRYRRSLYTRLWRSAVYPFFTTFDAPVPTVTCTRRSVSVSPLQALTLANDPMVLEIAVALGERGAEWAERAAGLAHMFTACVGRPPGEAELDVLEAHWQREFARAVPAAGGDALADLGDDAGEGAPPAEAPGLLGGSPERRAWSAVGRVLLNLHAFQVRS